MLGVVVYHVFIFTGALNRARGSATSRRRRRPKGPILFFAISGFLLYRPWVASRAAGKPAPRTLRYARRRALRILPAYWFALIVLGIWPGITGVFTGDWWRYDFFLQLYDTDTLGLGIPVAWTLCVEVTFYLALPLWVAAVRPPSGCGPSWPPSARSRSPAWRSRSRRAARRSPDVLAQSLLGQSTWFALGMALAIASVAGRERLRVLADRPWLCVAGAALAFAALIPLRHQPERAARDRGRAADAAALPEAAGRRRPDRDHAVPAAHPGRLGHARARAAAVPGGGAARLARADLLRRLPLAPHDRRAAHPPLDADALRG